MQENFSLVLSNWPVLACVRALLGSCWAEKLAIVVAVVFAIIKVIVMVFHCLVVLCFA
jgi:hypothetical protein